jgi:hypothetical protein
MTLRATPLALKPAGRYDRHFYSGIAFVAAIIVFAGFAPTYFLRARFESTPLPLYLHVHGFLFTSWIALFVVQAGLVAARRVDLHRKLGWATAGLAVAMVGAGAAAGILSMRGEVAAGYEDQARTFLTTPLLSMVVFAALVAAAVSLRRQPQTHKRLMLLATIGLLDAPIARLPFAIVSATTWGHYVFTDVFIVAAILYDLVVRRRVERAYLWGGLLIVIGQALRTPLGETNAWHVVARALIG